MNNYYNKKYLAWQKKAGLYGAEQDTGYYRDMIKPTDTVLDFGCGGGYILEALPGKRKYGVDINEAALQLAATKGIKTYTSLSSLPRQTTFDVIITHHTLEHVDNPYEILMLLQKKLKKNGIIIGVLPIDDWRNQKNYRMKDVNNHLYTWTPLLLRNLLVRAGFKIISISLITSAWLPFSRYYYRYTPHFMYRAAAALWSALIRSRQLRFVVTKRS